MSCEDQQRMCEGQGSPTRSGGLSTQRHATHWTLAGLTCITIVFSGWLAADRGVSGCPFPGGGSAMLSGPPASAPSSREAWERMAPMHSSTWKCRKLFQVYLKNRSWVNRGQRRVLRLLFP